MGTTNLDTLKVNALSIGASTIAGGLVLGESEVVDLNGEADSLVLDADGDTTISAPTDDQIDIEVAGADDFRITANTLTALSGSTIATNTIAETTSGSGVTIDGLLVKDGGVKPTPTAASADGAITIPASSATIVITKADAAALTLANPTATTHDGVRLTIVATTAAAHTVSNAAGAGFNAASTSGDVATFGGAKGDAMEIVAYQGVWYTVSLNNVTLG